MNIFNRFSIRTRLVCITVIILTLCCVGLTVIMNYSATLMASEVAQTMMPAQSVDELKNQRELGQSAMNMGESTEGVERKHQIINTFYRNSILYMLFIIISGGTAMYLFSKRILFPLSKLNKKIKDSTITNLSNKLTVPSSNDEIAELTDSFNKMTDRIQEAFLFQQQFSGNVAHELRTPLTIMKTK